jgi:hypothetical protein
MEMTRPILQVEIISKEFEHSNRLAHVRLFGSLLGVGIDAEGPEGNRVRLTRSVSIQELSELFQKSHNGGRSH